MDKFQTRRFGLTLCQYVKHGWTTNSVLKPTPKAAPRRTARYFVLAHTARLFAPAPQPLRADRWAATADARRLSAAPWLVKLAANRDLASDGSERTSGGRRTHCARNTEYAHYLRQTTKQVYLYGPEPSALAREAAGEGPFHLSQQPETLPRRSGSKIVHELDQRPQGAAEPGCGRRFSRPTLGAWDWGFVLSAPERAILELLDELPG
jgi:hypothetical protein